MKTWLEYIKEEAEGVGLEVHPLTFSDGQFAVYRVFRLGEPIVDWPIGEEGRQPGDFVTREEVEAFVLGVVFGRTGKVK